MAEAIVSFGVQKLWDLLSQEYEQFQGTDDQVTELKRDLNLLSSFLKDAEAKKHTSAVVRNCVEEIKEIICDAEDILETFLLKDKVEKRRGVKMRIRRLACIIPNRMEIASDIRGISKRISKVIRDMQSFGVQQMIVDGGQYSHPLQERRRELRQEYSRDYESNLVGLEEIIKKLVGYIVEEDAIQVFSITGMGGIGKTTLARQIFNNELVKNKFDGFAWVCVSQEFTRKYVWQTILRSLSPSEEEDQILQMTEPTLQDNLFQLLETSKSLIVLDDIWKQEDWNRIEPIFPPNEGWKVLFTSRNEGVAVRGEIGYINFKPECLTFQDSWTLFQMIAFPRRNAFDYNVIKEMKEMGKQMIKHCGGLPLAVRVLGGLFAAKYTLHDWKRIYENIGSHIVGRTENNNSRIYYVLSLSFEELSSYLKHCFLYLAHFPEDYPINVEKLSYYWAGDGISKPRYYDGATIRDVADGYIEELMKRNMVIAERDTKTLRFETCHLHDMMREICLIKAKEENFLQISGIHSSTVNSQYPGTSRRFVSQNPTTLHVERDINNQKLRSLLIVLPDRRNWMLSGSSFTRLKLLRVLDLYGAKFEGGELPSDIGKLIHLRYLSLKWAQVHIVPYYLRNLKLLIYLNMDASAQFPIYVPNVLTRMQELRYLALPKEMDKKKKLELINLVNLETLKNFSTKNGSLENLHGMTRLRTLVMEFCYETSMKTLSESIGGLRYLENIELYGVMPMGMREEGFDLDCIHLKQLELCIYMPKLPDEQHFPYHLTTISLEKCRLKEDPMPILGKLLQLKEVRLMPRSFCGRKMVCLGGGFPQLQKLVLFGLEELEEWIREEGSMPLLYTLIIYCCDNYEKGKDYYKFRHIPLY